MKLLISSFNYVIIIIIVFFLFKKNTVNHKTACFIIHELNLFERINIIYFTV